MNLDRALEICGMKIAERTNDGSKNLVLKFCNTDKVATFNEVKKNFYHYGGKLEEYLQSLDSNFLDIEDPIYVSHYNRVSAWQLVFDSLKEVDEVLSKDQKKYSTQFQPSLLSDDNFKEIVEIMSSHRIKRIIDTSVAFGYVNNCSTCGELSISDEEDFHIAHMLLVAGFDKK